MTPDYQDLGGASDWLKQIFHVALPIIIIKSPTKICVVMRRQYGISVLVSQTSLISWGNLLECWPHIQATLFAV